MGPLVTTDWLAAELGKPDLVIFDATKYLPNEPKDGVAEFRRAHASAVPTAKKFTAQLSERRISCLWPAGGIQDNTVNRLLLMSNSEHHLASVPMALFVHAR